METKETGLIRYGKNESKVLKLCRRRTPEGEEESVLELKQGHVRPDGEMWFGRSGTVLPDDDRLLSLFEEALGEGEAA